MDKKIYYEKKRHASSGFVFGLFDLLGNATYPSLDYLVHKLLLNGTNI
jgi:hypothetical protein